MTPERTACEPSMIDRFLRDQLEQAEQHALERHLEVCETCRQLLKDSAAEADWWNDARSYLGPEDPCGLSADSSLAATPADKTAAADRTQLDLGFLHPTDDPRMIGRLGGYEIVGVIGRGGMGIVLKGLDLALSRYVAIKVLAPHLAENAGARQRFARESQAAAAVVHENVIAIHSVQQEQGLPYLVMPYFRGESLQRRIDHQGPLATCEVLRIGMQVAAGLAAAHAQGLVHRDIKPANILLSDGVERVKITDFGLARAADDASLTHSGVIAGTPQYMSPEQARGDSVDARSDLFSLGSVLYALCTGHAPFRAETSYGVLQRICHGRPRPVREISPQTPEWLGRIIDRLHAKSPDERFQTASEVAEVLEQCLAHVQDPFRPLPAWLQTPSRGKHPERWRRLLAVVAVVCLTVLGIWGAMQLSGRPSVAPPANSPNAEAAGRKESADPLPAANLFQWNDGIDEQLNELEREAVRLEARTLGLASDSGASAPTP